MSLPASEERVLSRIEQHLLHRDPRFRSLFSIFTRLTRHEAMPATEQLRRRRWSPHPSAVLLLAVALLIGAIVAGAFGPSRSCGPARQAATASARTSAIATSALDPACTARRVSAVRTP
jgi:hypothetical protein